MSCRKERCRFCHHDTVENKVCFWCGLSQEIVEPEPTESYETIADECEGMIDKLNHWSAKQTTS